jgi:hypothetical protein
VQLGQTGGGGIRYVGRWDGATRYGDISSAALGSAFNPNKGALHIWGRVSSSSVWTDGSDRALVRIFADVSNSILLRKASANNRLVATYTAGGTADNVNIDGVSLTNLFHFVLTWNTTNDVIYSYLNAVNSGNSTTLGTWVGAANNGFLGSINAGPLQVWDNDLAFCGLYNIDHGQSVVGNIYNAGK